MKINFQIVTVQGLIAKAGNIGYIDLVDLARAHGIEAVQVYEQIDALVEGGKVKTWFTKEGTKYSTEKRVAREFDGKEYDRILKFITQLMRNRKFRSGDVARKMNDEGFRWYQGEEEMKWTGILVGPYLHKLAAEGQLIEGKKTTKGQYYWFPDWRPKEKM